MLCRIFCYFCSAEPVCRYGAAFASKWQLALMLLKWKERSKKSLFLLPGSADTHLATCVCAQRLCSWPGVVFLLFFYLFLVLCGGRICSDIRIEPCGAEFSRFAQQTAEIEREVGQDIDGVWHLGVDRSFWDVSRTCMRQQLSESWFERWGCKSLWGALCQSLRIQLSCEKLIRGKEIQGEKGTSFSSLCSFPLLHAQARFQCAC